MSVAAKRVIIEHLYMATKEGKVVDWINGNKTSVHGHKAMSLKCFAPGAVPIQSKIGQRHGTRTGVKTLCWRGEMCHIVATGE